MTNKIQNPNDQNVLGFSNLGFGWDLEFMIWDFEIYDNIIRKI